MASSQLYSEAHGNVGTLINAGPRAKEYAVKLARRYADSSREELGQVIPTPLEAPHSRLAVLPTGCTANDPAGHGAREANETEIAEHTEIEQQDAKAEEDSFAACMREYENTAKEKYKTGIDPHGKHTVEQLWIVIDEAVDKYKNADTKGPWGKLRLAFRKLGDGGQAVTGWLGLLPTESEYLSIVCGGLKLIITAASRMKNVADKVLEALCELPMILGSAKRVLRLFKDSPGLRAQSDALYTSVLAALGHMLAYLRRKSGFKRVLKAAFQQSGFEEGLVAKIDRLRSQRNRFNEEAELCHKEMVKRIEDAAESAKKRGEATSQLVQDMMPLLALSIHEQQRTQVEIKQQHVAIESAGLEMLRRQNDMRLELDTVKNLLLGVFVANPQLQNVAHEAQKPLVPDEEEPEEAAPRAVTKASKMTLAEARKLIENASQRRRELLEHLHYDPNMMANDLETNLGLKARLSREEQDRSVRIIKSEKLASWIRSDRSAVLFVEGNSQNLEHQRAGVSYVGARLVRAIELVGSPNMLPLHFFCAQHSYCGKKWDTPAGVANSLLAQALELCSGDVDVADVASLGEFRGSNTKAVLKRLKAVLASIPPSVTVFCVVDSVSNYVAEPETESDARELISALVRTARSKSKKRCAFKLLLTAPKRLGVEEVENAEEQETLLVPSSPPKTSGLTDTMWDLEVGSKIKQPSDSNSRGSDDSEASEESDGSSDSGNSSHSKRAGFRRNKKGKS